MIRVMVYFIVAFIFTGCMVSEPVVTYEQYEKPNNMQKSTPKKDITFEKKTKTISKVVKNTGSIRGYVTKLFYNGSNGVWEYEVKSKDTSNKKLSHARFYSSKKIAKKGDLVYAVIKKGKLKEIFLIKKANYKQKKTKYVKKTVKQNKKIVHRRTKKRQILGVPTSEAILLD